MRTIASRLLLAVPLVGLLAACTTEKIVYRDRDPFNEPVAAARGFLGYYTVENKRTTCGNCHVDYQTKWLGSAHAGAYASLPANAQDFCKSCHSVNQRGNLVTETAGWDATQDPIYRDVQCESCHGPGLDHVRAVNQGQIVRPLAKLGMAGEGTCADCHSGAHHPYAEEWAASNHGKLGTRAANATCAPCHEGRGALAAWGITSNFVEKAGPTDYVAVASCATCHDPHGSANPGQLRFPIESQDLSQNLCIKCHLRYDAPTNTSSSPHAPQGSLLLGTAGYRPAGFVYEEQRIFGSHATEANPRLCAGCHVDKYTVTDPQSGNFVFSATGHLMRAIPCLDAEGKPTANKNCDYTPAARSWNTCTGSGCHANAAAASNAFNSRRDLMALLTGQLWTDVNGNNQLQAFPTDQGLLPRVRQLYPGEWSTTDNRVSPAEGAEFNARLCGSYGQSTADNSKGTHNPFLCQALLVASINEIIATYNLPAPPAELQAILDMPIGPIGGSPDAVRRSSVPIPGHDIRVASRHEQ